MRLSLAFVICVLCASTAAAGVEVTILGGYRGDGISFPIEARLDPASPGSFNCVTTPCLVATAATGSGRVEPVLIIDVSISERWMVEVLVTEESGDLELRHDLPAEVLLAGETYSSGTGQVGLLRGWGDGRYRPYVAGAVGGTRFESTALAYDGPLLPGINAVRVDEEVLSASLAGGLKADLGRRLALRLEARSYWHDLPARLGGGSGQVEAGLGISYRW